MTRLLPSLFALLLLLPLLAAPLPAQAALVACGTSANPDPCTLCHLVSGVATITDYIRDIMVFAALAIIAAMGILYIVSAGNPGMMETAKKGVFAALAGLVIILAAWIIVNTVMFVVFEAKNDLGVGASFSVSGGFEFDCASPSSATGGNIAALKPGPCTIVASPAAPTTGGGITLTASCQGGTPSSYAWTGSCTASGDKCVENGLTLGPHTYQVTASNTAGSATAAKTVTAGAAASTTYALSISKDGSGTVTGTGISCGSDCAESYASGTNVALTASPAAGNLFASWGGACTGNTPTCTVAMTEVWTVFANFIPIPPPGTYLLAVSKDGSGTGTVTGPGISCGADCSQTYTGNPTVTLTATTGANSVFEGWFGACSGTGTCSIPMTSAKSVAASFTSTVVAGGESGGSGGGGGGTSWYAGDPGSGSWYPPGMSGVIVVDTGSSPTSMHIPACANGANSAPQYPCYSGFESFANGFTFGGTKVMSIRMQGVSAPKLSALQMKSGDGGNMNSGGGAAKMSISSVPGDFSVSSNCVYTFTGIEGTNYSPMLIYANNQTEVDAYFAFIHSQAPPGFTFCPIDPGKYYYVNIMVPNAQPNEQFYLDYGPPLQ